MPFKYFGKINFTPYTKVDKFADYLQKGKLMGTKCKKCGETYFPPRADCLKCMNDKFEWIEYSGKGTLNSFTTIYAAPKGFEDIIPYTLGVVDLEEGGRLLAWITNPPENLDDIKLNSDVLVEPKVIDENKIFYELKLI